MKNSKYIFKKEDIIDFQKKINNKSTRKINPTID